jgi:hypothetical protein
MEEQQLECFHTAVERKKERSKAASEQDRQRDAGSEGALPDEQASLIDRGRPQDSRDPRAKSEGHGKKTADKWNQ